MASDRDQDDARDDAAGGRAESDQDRIAYLEEKTRVLTERVDDLEAALAELDAQIADLEASHTAPASKTSPSGVGDEGQSDSRSIWTAI